MEVGETLGYCGKTCSHHGMTAHKMIKGDGCVAKICLKCLQEKERGFANPVDANIKDARDYLLSLSSKNP